MRGDEVSTAPQQTSSPTMGSAYRKAAQKAATSIPASETTRSDKLSSINSGAASSGLASLDTRPKFNKPKAEDDDEEEEEHEEDEEEVKLLVRHDRKAESTTQPADDVRISTSGSTDKRCLNLNLMVYLQLIFECRPHGLPTIDI